MPLPITDNLRIDESKITDYLLSTVHPRGSDKAAFFAQFGFTVEVWVILAEALQAHA